MLKSMRKNIKSLAPTLWFVIIAFIISIFAVWGGAGRLGERGGGNTLVTVDGDRISGEQYYQILRQRLEMMKREFSELDSRFIQQLNIPQQVLNEIIQQSLLTQAAKEMGIRASDEEIRKKIMSYPVFQKDGRFVGFDQYRRILEWNRISLAAFEKSLRQEVAMEKVAKLLTASVTVTEQELWENYKNTHDTAKIEYVVLEVDKVEAEGEPTESELRDYFENNKEKFQIPEKREADYVFLETEELKKEIEITDEELRKYYADNTERFKEPEKIKVSRIWLPLEDEDKEAARKKAGEILDRLEKGEDFGELAKSYSQDEKAAESGDWGLYDWKRLSSQEQDRISALQEGEVSDPVELDEGIALLKVTEKTPESLPPFESVRERVFSILEDQKARELAEEKISRLEKAARREQSLDVAAQKLGYRTKSTGLLGVNAPLEDIDPSGAISMALFNLEEKQLSSPIYTYQGVGLAQLTRIEPSRPATFEEAKLQVLEEVRDLKKKESAEKRIRKVKKELGRKNLEALAEEYGLEYKTVNEHKRGQYLSIIGENEEIDRLAFSLPVGDASDPVEFETGYALVRVLDRKEATREEFEKDKESERETYLEMKRNKFFASFMARMRETKEIKINYDLYLKLNADILARFGGEETSE